MIWKKDNCVPQFKLELEYFNRKIYNRNNYNHSCFQITFWKHTVKYEIMILAFTV